MARRRRTGRSSFFRKAKRRGHKSIMGGGIVGNMVSGAVIGAGISLAGPTINQYVPGIGPLSPTAVALIGGGVAAKSIFHKGGSFATAAITIGTAMAASSLTSGMGGTSSGGGLKLY